MKSLTRRVEALIAAKGGPSPCYIHVHVKSKCLKTFGNIVYVIMLTQRDLDDQVTVEFV